MGSLTRTTLSFSFRLFLTCSLIVSAFAFTALAQEGASSAAASRTRYLSESGLVPPSREIAVEEIVNYHRHQIGRPKAGEAVLMDVRWGNEKVSTVNGEAVLQIGFSTALSTDRQQLRPLNLSLVIDRSGSMQAADKMSRVKAALQTLVSQLRETDLLSIVVFDSEAQVLIPSRQLGDRREIRELIRGIFPGASTNLHAGLMLGYREALKQYRKDSTNRVILLTDGIANQGVTDPGLIAEDSLKYNDRGIDLSTIGVGLDLNQDLLRELAKSGRGLFHFVADDGDIQKVFVSELQSLISPVATQPNLEINFGSDLELVKLYGYEPKLRAGGVSLKLDNMNQGLTQVVMLHFRVSSDTDPSNLPVTVRFTYQDLDEQPVVKLRQAFLNVTDGPAGDMLLDSEVGKNYHVALLAQAIHDMAVACESRRYQEAENLLTRAIGKTDLRYPSRQDADINRTLQIAEKYQAALRKYNQERSSEDSK
jgi:Ca-activated chloride channel family protein